MAGFLRAVSFDFVVELLPTEDDPLNHIKTHEAQKYFVSFVKTDAMKSARGKDQTANVTNSVRLRIAVPADAEKITTVINSAFRLAEEFFVDGDRIDVGRVLDFLSTGMFLLAEDEEILIGCVYFEPRRDRAYLGLLSVDPSRQQSGMGSVLMAAAEDHCRRLACRFMDVKVVNLRKSLPGFYRRRGYVETGTSPFPADVKTKAPCFFIDMSKPLQAENSTQSNIG